MYQMYLAWRWSAGSESSSGSEEGSSSDDESMSDSGDHAASREQQPVRRSGSPGGRVGEQVTSRSGLLYGFLHSERARVAVRLAQTAAELLLHRGRRAGCPVHYLLSLAHLRAFALVAAEHLLEQHGSSPHKQPQPPRASPPGQPEQPTARLPSPPKPLPQPQHQQERRVSPTKQPQQQRASDQQQPAKPSPPIEPAQRQRSPKRQQQQPVEAGGPAAAAPGISKPTVAGQAGAAGRQAPGGQAWGAKGAPVPPGSRPGPAEQLGRGPPPGAGRPGASALAAAQQRSGGGGGPQGQKLSAVAPCLAVQP